METTIHADARMTLLERLPKRAVGAEVGVWKGAFSQRILATANPRELHLIDPWRLSERAEHMDARYGTKRAPNMEKIYNSVRERFAAQIKDGSVTVHRGLSSDILKTFSNDYFDFVYIDGDHVYEAVKADLFDCYAVVKTDGYICGDDYSLGGWWKDGVVKAMHEFVASRSVKIELVLGSQFLIRKVGN